MNATSTEVTVALSLGSLLWTAAALADSVNTDPVRQHPMNTETMQAPDTRSSHKSLHGHKQEEGSIREHPMNTEETMVEQPVDAHGQGSSTTSITEHPIEG